MTKIVTCAIIALVCEMPILEVAVTALRTIFAQRGHLVVMQLAIEAEANNPQAPKPSAQTSHCQNKQSGFNSTKS